MDLGRLMYNNILDEGSWNGGSAEKGKDSVEKNYLALVTELMGKMKEMSQYIASNYQRGAPKTNR